MSLIQRVPLALSALALSLAGLGNLLAPYSPAVRVGCGLLATGAVLLVFLRVVLDLEGARTELAAPAGLAVFPTLFMALMILATYLKPLAAGPAFALWAAALGMQLLVMGVFVARHVVSFKLVHVVPSWFVVFVGFVVATVTSPAFRMERIGQVLLVAGLVGYVGVLPVIVARMRRLGALPAPAAPTVAIFAAPPSLCLAGYLAVVEAKQPVVVYMLLAAAAVSLGYVLIQLPAIVRGAFFPSLASLTFPAVITATALKGSAAFLVAVGASFVVPKAVVATMDAAALLAVVYVLARYAVFVMRPADVPSAASAGAPAAVPAE